MAANIWLNRDTAVGNLPKHSAEAGSTTELDARIAEMRSLLARMRPGSDAEALKALRDAFPQSSLAERVAVLAGGARPQA